MTETKSRLEYSVNELVHFLEGEISIKDYFGEIESETKTAALIDNALDINYKIRADMKLLDFELTVSLGGPNIWCDSQFVYGRWGNDRIEITYADNIGLYEAIEEIYQAAVNIC